MISQWQVQKKKKEDELLYTVLDDQPRQYRIYANNDNELATVHIKVDCE